MNSSTVETKLRNDRNHYHTLFMINRKIVIQQINMIKSQRQEIDLQQREIDLKENEIKYLRSVINILQIDPFENNFISEPFTEKKKYSKALVIKSPNKN